jgi:hypothetical protein
MTKKKQQKKEGPTLSATGKRIGRPSLSPSGESVNLALRVTPELVDALDRYVAVLQVDSPGFRVSRNDAARRLMIVGMRQAGVELVEPKP